MRVSPRYRPSPRESRVDVAEEVGQEVEVAVLEDADAAEVGRADDVRSGGAMRRSGRSTVDTHQV